MADAGSGDASLFVRRIRDIVKRPPVTCAPAMSAVDLARLLARENVGSVVIVDGGSAPLGIVTDRDLSRKVVAHGRDPVATTARDIMSAPVIAVRPAAFAIEAVLEMTRREIHHVAVVDDGRLVGMISSHDFVALHGTHPVGLAREISRAVSFDALVELGGRVTAVVRRLVDDGVSPYDVGQIVAELNDRLVHRVLALSATELARAGEEAPPVAYCWLALGSEARREQTLRTDQDNALVYEDPPAELRERAATYHARLATAAVERLVALGFPPCPGGSMASNPRWCQPLSVWIGYFRRWMSEPTPEQLLAASIYFDVRPLDGALHLGAHLADIVRAEAAQHRRFLGLLARDVVSRRVPLTIFGNVAVRRTGPRAGTVDVKGAGTFPIVGAARLHALECGIAEANTIDRIRAAGARGLYTDAETHEITDAYQHLLRLRLVHQLDQLTRRQEPDNDVDPRRLSRRDTVLFRDALRTVSRVQAGIRERFGTEVMG